MQTSVAPRPNDTNQRSLAFEGFRQQILDARIKPGQFLTQRELVEILGLPLAAVREAIPRLEFAGLIRTVPNRGLQVATVSLKLIRNAWQVRALVEREAATHFVRTAPEEELLELKAQHQVILKRAKAKRVDADLEKDAREVDWGLHDRMVDSIGNEILSEIYRINSLHVRLIRFDADAIRPVQIVPAMEEHLEFLDLALKRDVEGAVNQILAHLESSKQRVLHVMLEGSHRE